MEDFIKILNEIPKISAQLDELIKIQKEEKIEKKWLNVEETAHYIGYSKDKIYKLIQDEWVEGVHYFKPSGRVIIDKNKIDEWIKYGSSNSVNNIVNSLMLDLK